MKRLDDDTIKVNILGTDYDVMFGTPEEFPALKEMDGYTDTSIHAIVVDDMSLAAGDVCSKKNLEEYKKSVVRHEVIHAFLYESGLAENSHIVNDAWATNEEMVDWFAIQGQKIFKAFTELGAL